MRLRLWGIAVLTALVMGTPFLPAQAQNGTQLPPNIQAIVQQIRLAIQSGNVDSAARQLSAEIIQNPQAARLLTTEALQSAGSRGSDVLQTLSTATVTALVQSGGANAAGLVQSFTNGAVQAVSSAGGSSALIQAVVSGATQAAVASTGGNAVNSAALIRATTAGAVQGALATGTGSAATIESITSGAVIGAARASTKSTDGAVVANTVGSIDAAIRAGATDGATQASGGNAAIVTNIVQTVNGDLASDQLQGQAKTIISTAGQTTTPIVQNQNQNLNQTPVISLPTPPHSSAN